ncbi:aminoglycoside 6-adenylyltransferase [Flavonifractor sp. AGMB03687]|uniref:aminoglycoside 6-adenylyltransferase n=1 Tax=Flavonifractor sp. AGMB03687 TaxID=2785133 RepID=UPI001ADFD754|nr:aminoglycoside 6-adenylyltransferase [Flavonifractor sp. AGMB03687]
MRSETEMMELILEGARQDQRVLAAYLKGSRTNPNVPKDPYRDFDVMYVVTETESFRRDTRWLDRFGTILLKQEQGDELGFGERFGLRDCFDQLYSWLLIFGDGNRIDIGVETVEHMERGATRNKLFLPLLDKVGCLPKLPPPSDEDFHVKVPAEKRYLGCCNGFFWSLCDVIKGCMREELPYAMSVYHTQARPMVEQMLEWYVGCETGFSLSCGKEHRFFQQYLPEELYEAFTHTYAAGSFQVLEDSIHSARQLFRKTALLVAERLSFSYPDGVEEGFLRYQQLMADIAETEKK